MPGANPTSLPVVVMGIDPGLTRCGLGVVAGPPGQPRHRHHECVTTAPKMALELRLAQLYDRVEAAIATYEPTVVAVERVLFSKNVNTAMATGHAAGVVMLAAARAHRPVLQLTPTDVKASVAGDGAADKRGVARMVVAQLRLATTPRPADASDALAVALAALVRLRSSAATSDRPPTAASGSWEQAIAARGLTVAGGTRRADATARRDPARARPAARR